MDMSLSALRQGECGYVSGLTAQPGMLRRLSDLGLVPGTRVCCELVSPAGDPAAYRVRGTLIALRRKDAGQVAVAPCAARASGEEGAAT